MNLFNLVFAKIYNFIVRVINPNYYKSQYSIKKGYRHRANVIPFDDTLNKDMYQKEVYADALKLFIENNYTTVLDIGCGSAYKLINNFKFSDFIGVEVEPTLSFLKNKHPNFRWEKLDYAFGKEFDIIIFADVIEHVESPAKLIYDIIEKIRFKYIFISTPDRDLLYPKYHFGPPKNVSHYREWSFQEFNDFIKFYLKIEKHYISNKSQATQVVVCQKYT